MLSAVVLVLGYAALHALSGAGNAPQVEKVLPAPPAATGPASNDADQQPIHTLHPMTTSEVIPAVAPQGIDVPFGGREYVERQTWLELPEEAARSQSPQR